MKIARAHTGRPGVIAFSGGFHGRTYMTMALTGKVAPYKIGFGPFPGSVYHVPYPSDLHGISTQDSLDARPRTAAMAGTLSLASINVFLRRWPS
ncbi:aminotransferase class III-fold pyridoxal phosphate-dependent enzyme, partial [Escherichia sp. R-CC3]